MAEHVIGIIHVGPEDFLIEVVGETTERWPPAGNRDYVPGDFPGLVVGFNWTARDAATLAEVSIRWVEGRGGTRTERTLPTRSGLSGQVRFSTNLRDPRNIGVQVTRAYTPDRLPRGA